ncbi:hypothetical protein RJ53_11135, partial [Methanocalculus chunghsingensis]
PTPEPTPVPVPEETASIRFTSNPAGAEIFINGDLKGTTPMVVPGFTLGEHDVEYRLEGYERWGRQIVVTEAALTTTWSYNPTLTPVEIIPEPTPVPVPEETASIRFTSNPAGAEIFINGDLKGTTPMVVPGFTLGEHDVEYRLEGYERWGRQIVVTEAALTTTWSYNPRLVSAL